MKEARVASRYAKSLLQLAIEQGQLEVVDKDMRLIRNATRDSKELSLVINSPIIKGDKKGSILRAIFAEKVSKVSMDFIDILIRKRREYLVDDIAEAFELQYKTHIGSVTAVVTTASAMSDEQRSKVMTLVQELGHSKSVEIKEVIDESIIGGIIIQVGDKQLDESVSRRLADYKKQFSKNQYVADF
jgi:F-type H+-transporting ATPase subunit delta